jgi:N5-(carboxyethyl)ornithine synthase
MRLGFIKPNYPNEKRVALLPVHIKDFENELIIESGFGESLDISDAEYEAKGCTIKSREEIFTECNTLFNLKLLQPSDYDKVREGQMIIGWTHPTGSGTKFMELQGIPKKLVIVDLDNIYPFIFYNGRKISISFIKPNFIWRNSFMAGFSSTLHAILSVGILPDSNTKVAVLASGNVAQGAYKAISKFNCDIRLFYRKTMDLFYESIGDYDIIINGIEIDDDNSHIITKEDIKKIKKGCLMLDAAADAGRAIEGTKYTTIGNPIYLEDGKYFYEVNNSPSIFYRESSRIISGVFSEWIYKKDIQRFWDLLK